MTILSGHRAQFGIAASEYFANNHRSRCGNFDANFPIPIDLTTETQRVYHDLMTKKLIRHGNSAALVLDKALLDLLKVQMDTPLEITTDGRNIIISPQNEENAEASLLDVLERINAKHGSTLKKLAQ